MKTRIKVQNEWELFNIFSILFQNAPHQAFNLRNPINYF
jgi:hypothetical protein